jgi:hypothetical protein
MKITITSTFHDGMKPITFRRCEPGVNIRRLRGTRSRYCMDYSNKNLHVCGCGFPRFYAKWDAGEGWEVPAPRRVECGPRGEEYGRGYIRFEIVPAQ